MTRLIGRRGFILLLVVALLLAVLFVVFNNTITIQEPNVSVSSIKDTVLTIESATASKGGANWISRAPSGLWELYLEGDPFERGYWNGRLSEQLIYRQERYFSSQLKDLVPNAFYRWMLKYGIGWFTKDIDDFITTEQKQEIYGISLSASKEFDHIASPYQRLLTYHAAHDIGHAVQNMALVGCSSFATWGSKSENRHLIIGRNFDFFVNDSFALEKIVLFQKPEQGIPFVSVTWGGMSGVVSGMNTAGLSVTLNAAPSSIPTECATPVSLIAREILQYAHTINEAIEIATHRSVFVSELLLIGSLADNKAVVIEKTPDTTSVYDPGGERLICTNHFNSKVLGSSQINTKHLIESSSSYRYNTLTAILDTVRLNSPEIASTILRTRHGLDNQNLGNGNELSINQLICHHSVIFDLTEKMIWISDGPWQVGPYSAYSLDSIFNSPGFPVNGTRSIESKRIDKDPFLGSIDYDDFIAFRKLKEQTLHGINIDIKKLIRTNPYLYSSYVLAADQLFRNQRYDEAMSLYISALGFPVPTAKDRNHINERLKECKRKGND